MKRLSFFLLCLFFAGMQTIMAQGVSISGRTTDGTTGETLPGVTVQVKGTTVGAISQADGTYRIANVPAGATTLIFSFIGYTTQEVEISGRTTIDVVMSEEATALDEIVVTGYTVERKKDIIGSVAVVNTEEMLATATGNLTSQLSGRVAGVTVSGGGELGGDAKVRIRGFGSFSGSDPLYIIDGVPGDIDRINPNDIESLQVLKDAASASVYGARAANGVVIITTRRGQAGNVKVNYDGYYAVNYFNDFPELLNAEENGQAIWKAMEGAGRQVGDANWFDRQYGSGATPVIPEYILVKDAGTTIGGAELESIKASDPARFAELTDLANYDYATHPIVKGSDTDWFDEVFRPAPVMSHQLTVSGGSDKGTFVVGLGYFDQKAETDEYSYYKRYTVRANTTFNIFNNIQFGENLQILYNEGREVGNTSTAWTMHPLIPVWDEGGYPAGAAAPDLVAAGDTGRNPLGEAWHNRFDGYRTYGIFGNIFGQITLFKDLVAKTSFGIDYRTTTSRNLTQVTYEHSENTNPPNSLNWSWNDGNAWTFTNTLTYSKTFGSNVVRLLVGTEAINDVDQSISATRLNIALEEDLNFQVLNAATGTQTNSGTKSRSALFSVFGRFDYTYGDKYIFNATLRRDGSSKFGINNRYGYFPAAALGWRVSSEDFMSAVTWVTDLKLRASYGIIGNQSGLTNENQYTLFQSVDGNTYPLQGLNNQVLYSFSESRIGNPDARWEKTATTNIGFDLSMFTGALMFNFDYFIRKTSDLLVQDQAPLTGSSATKPYVNVGEITNKGIELNVSYRGTMLGEVDYEVTANWSKYSNNVDKVLNNEEAALYGGGGRMGNVTITKAGNPISMFYGYQIDGFFNSQAEVDAYNAEYTTKWLTPAVGRWRIKDINGDKAVNDLDKTYIGSPHPDFQASINVDLKYKNFDLAAFLFWNQGGNLFNFNRYRTDFMTFRYNRSARYLYDSWTPDNQDALLPKLDINDNVSNRYATDYFVEDATYLRLRNLQLGYTVPASIATKIKMQRLRIYVAAQNLFTISKYSGLDPGLGISGGDLGMGVVSNERPTPKQVLFGVNIGF